MCDVAVGGGWWSLSTASGLGSTLPGVLTLKVYTLPYVGDTIAAWLVFFFSTFHIGLQLNISFAKWRVNNSYCLFIYLCCWVGPWVQAVTSQLTCSGAHPLAYVRVLVIEDLHLTFILEQGVCASRQPALPREFVVYSFIYLYTQCSEWCSWLEGTLNWFAHSSICPVYCGNPGAMYLHSTTESEYDQRMVWGHLFSSASLYRETCGHCI
jgi:hypothetical protein